MFYLVIATKQWKLLETDTISPKQNIPFNITLDSLA